MLADLREYQNPGEPDFITELIEVFSEDLTNRLSQISAGLQAGDLIVAIDGTPIHSVADLHKKLDFAHVGDELNLSVLRDGKSDTVKVRIETNRPSQRQSRQWN